MNQWGDKPEDLEEKKFHVGFMLNFKSMSKLLQEMSEYIGEPTPEYPKKELQKLWVNLLGIFFVLFLCSKAAFIFVTIPFCFFYGYVLIQLIQTWKGFKYKVGPLIGLTVVILAVLFVAAMALGEVITPMIANYLA